MLAKLPGMKKAALAAFDFGGKLAKKNRDWPDFGGQSLGPSTDANIDATGAAGDKKSKVGAFYARKARIQKKLSAKHGIGLAQIQKLLKLKPDGRYGRNTYRAIKAFQKKHKFKVDGLVGGETIVAMRKADKGIKAASDKVGTEMPGFAPGKGGKVTAGSYDTMSMDQLKKKRLELYRQVKKLEKTEGGTRASAKARQVYDNIVAAFNRKQVEQQKKITDDPGSAQSRTKRGAAELEKRKAARKGRR